MLVAQSTSDDRDWLLITLTPNGSLAAWWWKSTVDNAAAVNTVTNLSANAQVLGGDVYLRLRRVGNVFSSFYSMDGAAWTQVGSSATRNDFSSDARVGLASGSLNTAGACTASCDFLRSWPPYVTTSQVGSVVIDSGVDGTVWDMSTFDALANMYQEFNPQNQPRVTWQPSFVVARAYRSDRGEALWAEKKGPQNVALAELPRFTCLPDAPRAGPPSTGKSSG